MSAFLRRRAWARTSSRSRSTRRLRIEPLEDRTVPSATAVFDQNTGVLTITGDAGNPNDLFVTTVPGDFGKQIAWVLNGLASVPITDTNSAPTVAPMDGVSVIVVNTGDQGSQATLDSIIKSAAEIHGGSGNDTLIAGGGPTTLDGGAGDDSLVGGLGSDSLIGGDGNDNLTGDRGNDSLSGGAGNDSLDGGIGNDVLYGGSGTNSLTGGPGKDVWLIQGTSQADVIQVDSGAGTGTVNSGGVIQQDAFSDLRPSQDRLTVDAGTGSDAVTVTGSISATLFGSDGNDSLTGGSGPDYLHGGPGDDRLSGGNGKDMLFGDAGNDSLDGEAGNDSLIDSGGTDLMRPGPGNDQVWTGDSTRQSGNIHRGPLDASGMTITVNTTIAISGGIQGFSGSASVHVVATMTRNADGTVSGSISIDGTAHGAKGQATADGTFSGGGSLSGSTLTKISWTVGYTGSGQVTLPDGTTIPGTIGGSYSGSFDATTGKISSKFKPTPGQIGLTGGGKLKITEFTVTLGDARFVGQPKNFALWAASIGREAFHSAIHARRVLELAGTKVTLPDWQLKSGGPSVLSQVLLASLGLPIHNPVINKDIVVNPRIWDTIINLANDPNFGSVTPTEIAGGDHTGKSLHYSGQAVDIGALGGYDLAQASGRVFATEKIVDDNLISGGGTVGLVFGKDNNTRAETFNLLAFIGAVPSNAAMRKKLEQDPTYDFAGDEDTGYWTYKGTRIRDDPGDLAHIHIQLGN